MSLTVLIADDEPLITDSVQVLINEIAPEIEVVNKIHDGRQVWRYIQTHQPDAVFLDIIMPKMDGFEILEKISKHQYDTKVIILSAYRDFEYAQKAIHLGAIDYLAKPIDQNSLCNSLDKLKKLHSRDITMQQATTLHSFGELMKGGPDAQKQFDQWDFFQGLPNEKIQVAVVLFEQAQIYDYYREYRKLPPSWKQCLRPLWINPHYWVIIYKSALIGQAPGINTIRSSLSPKKTAIGFSEVVDSIDFPKAFYQAKNAVQHRFYDSNKVLFLESETKPFAQKKTISFGTTMVEERLLEKIRLNLKNETLSVIKEYFLNAKKLLVQPSVLCEDMIDLFAYLRAHTKYLPGDKDITVAKTIQSFKEMRELDYYYTADEMMKWVLDTIDIFLINSNQNSALTDRRRIIRKVQQYCERHYHEEITLEMVVKEVHITKSWFCSIFKKETGQSFGSYLTDLRMKKAKELLVTTEEKINQVAADVGYKNASHFNHTFADKFGMTPLEYRRQNWGRTNE